MTYEEMMRENAIRAERREAMYKEAGSPALQACEPTLQYTLSSGTRCTITGILDKRLQITCAGGNPWATEDGTNFLMLGMLSAEDLREFLEIRLAIEAFKAGRLLNLPMPMRAFDPWVCPRGFEINLVDEER